MKILITGASSDIGQAMAKRLEPNHQIIMTSTKQSGSNIIGCNFEDFDATKGPLLELLADGVDAVILNACTRVEQYAPLHELDPALLHKFFNANTNPNIEILQKCLPKMMENKFGRIIFVSSLAAELGISEYASYILAKSALEGLMRNLAVDYGRYGITANTIRPGIIRTDRTAKVMSNPKYEIRVGRMIPLGVVGEPDQVAEVVELLLSKTSYINGQALNVGGGLPLVSMMKM